MKDDVFLWLQKKIEASDPVHASARGAVAMVDALRGLGREAGPRMVFGFQLPEDADPGRVAELAADARGRLERWAPRADPEQREVLTSQFVPATLRAAGLGAFAPDEPRPAEAAEAAGATGATAASPARGPRPDDGAGATGREASLDLPPAGRPEGARLVVTFPVTLERMDLAGGDEEEVRDGDVLAAFDGLRPDMGGIYDDVRDKLPELEGLREGRIRLRFDAERGALVCDLEMGFEAPPSDDVVAAAERGAVALWETSWALNLEWEERDAPGFG
ncbi:MAG TPA: hypothetical protein RMI62_31185, partial [Polyangiaceae bacterium LLY-WYZ-15_(1-7)]|nr:hypothetical protein [Polyangiaceae bacterium LLY-WYZ-15_(1-7)]